MKKFLSIVLVCLLFLTGCGKKETSVDVLKKVLNNEDEINSVSVKLDVDFQMEQEGMKVDMPLSASIKIDMKNEANGNFAINLADNPFLGAVELYASVANQEMTLYMPSSIIDLMVGLEDTEPHWIMQTETINEEETESTTDLEEYKKEFDKMFEVVTEKDFVYIDEAEGISHYELKITADLIKRLSEKMEEEYDSSKEETLVEPL